MHSHRYTQHRSDSTCNAHRAATVPCSQHITTNQYRLYTQLQQTAVRCMHVCTNGSSIPICTRERQQRQSNERSDHAYFPTTYGAPFRRVVDVCCRPPSNNSPARYALCENVFCVSYSEYLYADSGLSDMPCILFPLLGSVLLPVAITIVRAHSTDWRTRTVRRIAGCPMHRTNSPQKS